MIPFLKAIEKNMTFSFYCLVQENLLLMKSTYSTSGISSLVLVVCRGRFRVMGAGMQLDPSSSR